MQSMPNINETQEPGSPGQQAEPEGEEAEEEVVPRGSSGCDGVEQGVSVNALLAVLCHRDVHKSAHAPGKTPEELTEVTHGAARLKVDSSCPRRSARPTCDVITCNHLSSHVITWKETILRMLDHFCST